MSLSKYLMIPRLAWLSLRAPRDQRKAWERYWRSVQRTGRGGDVLWDAESEDELEQSRELIQSHMDTELPIVDIGCGNGSHARMLATCFPRVMGLDVSSAAIDTAREESRELDNIEYRAEDCTISGVGARLASELGDSNVYVRGVFHLLNHKQRLTMVQNIGDILGERGTLYLLETNHEGNPLDFLSDLGARPGSMPAPVLRVVESGVRVPQAVGEPLYRKYFATADWDTLLCNETAIHTVLAVGSDEIHPVRAFCAVARRRLES